MDGFFGIGLPEIFMIAVIALIVLGPERLPGTIREVAKFIKQVRAIGGDLMSQFGDEFKDLQDLDPRRILNDMTDPTKPDNQAKSSTSKPATPTPAKNTTSTTPTSAKPTTTTTSTPTKPTTVASTSTAGTAKGTSTSSSTGVANGTSATAASKVDDKKETAADTPVSQSAEAKSPTPTAVATAVATAEENRILPPATAAPAEDTEKAKSTRKRSPRKSASDSPASVTVDDTVVAESPTSETSEAKPKAKRTRKPVNVDVKESTNEGSES